MLKKLFEKSISIDKNLNDKITLKDFVLLT